jgi:hypothetical protein
MMTTTTRATLAEFVLVRKAKTTKLAEERMMDSCLHLMNLWALKLDEKPSQHLKTMQLLLCLGTSLPVITLSVTYSALALHPFKVTAPSEVGSLRY